MLVDVVLKEFYIYILHSLWWIIFKYPLHANNLLSTKLVSFVTKSSEIRDNKRPKTISKRFFAIRLYFLLKTFNLRDHIRFPLVIFLKSIKIEGKDTVLTFYYHLTFPQGKYLMEQTQYLQWFAEHNLLNEMRIHQWIVTENILK